MDVVIIKEFIESPLTSAFHYFWYVQLFSIMCSGIYCIILNKFIKKKLFQNRLKILSKLTLIKFLFDILFVFIGEIIWKSIYQSYKSYFDYVTFSLYYLLILSNPIALSNILLSIKYIKDDFSESFLIRLMNIILLLIGIVFTIVAVNSWR